VVWNTIDQLRDLGILSNRRAFVTDPTLGEYRPRIIVSEQITPAYDQGIARANWEMARRIGRSQSVTIVADSWRDKNKKLWTPNWLAPISAPAADIDGDAVWIIGTVTLRKDMSGTHADLVLMPPKAFTPEPNPLTLMDNELALTPKVSQSPAPPSTDPPSTPGVH
jgi:prophage tail gpP-like protein